MNEVTSYITRWIREMYLRTFVFYKTKSSVSAMNTRARAYTHTYTLTFIYNIYVHLLINKPHECQRDKFFCYVKTFSYSLNLLDRIIKIVSIVSPFIFGYLWKTFRMFHLAIAKCICEKNLTVIERCKKKKSKKEEGFV